MKPSVVTEADEAAREVVFSTTDLAVYYGAFRAVRDINLPILKNEITALIGPSGCGKTTFLRCLNRMNDLIEGARVDRSCCTTASISTTNSRPGREFAGGSAWCSRSRTVPEIDLRQHRVRAEDRRVQGEHGRARRGSLHRAALWDEVKDKLKESGMALSGGQQQRLCIARAIATKPDVILMDEPCSALDPIATAKIEDLMQELVADYTIVIVTHNMQQAARVSDRVLHGRCARRRLPYRHDRGVRPPETIFTNPSDQRTEDYVTGRFG